MSGLWSLWSVCHPGKGKATDSCWASCYTIQTYCMQIPAMGALSSLLLLDSLYISSSQQAHVFIAGFGLFLGSRWVITLPWLRVSLGVAIHWVIGSHLDQSSCAVRLGSREMELTYMLPACNFWMSNLPQNHLSSWFFYVIFGTYLLILMGPSVIPSFRIISTSEKTNI